MSKETVLTINNGERKVSMYFTEAEDGAMDLNMAINPEPKEGEEPDMPLMLASMILNAIEKDDKSKIYDGQD